MHSRFRALLLDDDRDFVDLFRIRFRAAFPDVDLEVRFEPKSGGEFDVFFLDNDFHGEAMAEHMAQDIRCLHPDALIFAISASLSADTLKALLNLGCNGACDKSKPSDLQEMFRMLRRCLNERQIAQPVGSGRRGIFSTVRAITDLLREWNSRLDERSLQAK